MYNKFVKNFICIFYFLVCLISFIIICNFFNVNNIYLNFLNILMLVFQATFLIFTFLLVYLYFIGCINASKFLLLIFFYVALLAFVYQIIKESDFYKNISSVEDLRIYISSFKGCAGFVFVLIQIFQVIILPVPSIVITGTGVLLFGLVEAVIYSYIGIIAGSIIAFLIGKTFGYKFILWLFGKKVIYKYVDMVEERGERLLFFALLLPFFPDDMLCMLSGVSNMSFLKYLKMTLIARFISILTCGLFVCSSFDINMWWVAVLVIVLTISLFFIFKKYNLLKHK